MQNNTETLNVVVVNGRKFDSMGHLLAEIRRLIELVLNDSGTTNDRNEVAELIDYVDDVLDDLTHHNKESAPLVQAFFEKVTQELSN